MFGRLLDCHLPPSKLNPHQLPSVWAKALTAVLLFHCTGVFHHSPSSITVEQPLVHPPSHHSPIVSGRNFTSLLGTFLPLSLVEISLLYLEPTTRATKHLADTPKCPGLMAPGACSRLVDFPISAL